MQCRCDTSENILVSLVSHSQSKMTFRIGVFLLPMLIHCVSPCRTLEHVRRAFEKQLDSGALLPVNYLTRGSETCNFRDGSNRNYTKGSEWRDTPYPTCSLKVKYHVFTPSDKEATIMNAVNVESTKSAFEKAEKKLHQLKEKGRPLFIVSHGYLSSKIPAWGYEMKDELLDLGYNVILVEWYSMWKLYSHAAADTRLVADVTAVLIDELVGQEFVKSEQIVLVGFSLGAHIMGKAAEKATVANIKAVIGLDPAGPFFDCYPQLGLSRNSAPFVQVLHTDYRGTLISFGTNREVGHVDFFVNPHQRVQPGCSLNPLKNRYNLLGCSHERAPKLFNQIIKSQRRAECNRLGKVNNSSICRLSASSECNDKLVCIGDINVMSLWTLLGYTLKNEEPKKLGRFQVMTSSEGDFCGAKAKIMIKFSSKVTRDAMELGLIDMGGVYHGPFYFPSATPPRRKAKLEILLPLDIEYSDLEIKSGDEFVGRMTALTLRTKDKDKYTAILKKKETKDGKIVIPLERKR